MDKTCSQAPENQKSVDRSQHKPGLTVLSVLGQARIEVSDGENSISLDISRKGVERLIDELQTVLEMAD